MSPYQCWDDIFWSKTGPDKVSKYLGSQLFEQADNADMTLTVTFESKMTSWHVKGKRTGENLVKRINGPALLILLIIS